LRDALAFLWFLRQALILERLRVGAGPRLAVEFARRVGQRRSVRSAADRQTLRHVIAIADRLWTGGPNCYRRVLFEVAMDRGAAREIVQLGFHQSGEFGSGHAWLSTGTAADDVGRSYHAIVRL
jgi:hypothetical protein